jgi:hypothetical protein
MKKSQKKIRKRKEVHNKIRYDEQTIERYKDNFLMNSMHLVVVWIGSKPKYRLNNAYYAVYQSLIEYHHLLSSFIE